MINFITDFKNFIKIKKEEKVKKYCFFIENKHSLKYLHPYIIKKKINKIVIVSFERLEDIRDEEYFILKTLFFQTLFFVIQKFPFLYSTTPDLDTSTFYKSIFKKTKYIYFQHSPASLTHIYKDNSFINFDAVQAINKFQSEEIKKINQVYKKKIKCIKSPYLFLEKYKNNFSASNVKKKVLIAPTWSTDFYQLNLHQKIFDLLKKEKINYVFRPHPMSVKKKELDLEEIKKLKIDLDNEKQINFNLYSDLITDWSGIFFEFAIIKKKLPILINNKQKVRNTNLNIYSDWQPIEKYARNKIAHSIPVNKIENIVEIINKNESISEREIIETFYKEYFY